MKKRFGHHPLVPTLLALPLVACNVGDNDTPDNDIGIPLPAFSISDTRIVEGDSGISALTFTVTLSDTANGQVNIDYATADGTASAGSDYTAAAGTLVFGAGETTRTLTVAATGDTRFEANETLALTLSNPSPNATLGNATAIGTILNDDAGAVNDTGITACADEAANGLSCPQGDFPGQDAEVGRDADPLTGEDGDGRAGFAFTKLDADGAALPADAAGWSCVLDTVTGLVWEVKSDDGGLRDKDWTYTWYDADGIGAGGQPGAPDGGDDCAPDPNRCDTEKYAADVAATGLCGYSDWRLPEREELQSLADLSIADPGPTIDTNFFPNTRNGRFWTNVTYALSPAYAWGFDFGSGISNPFLAKSTPLHVRLVRGGP